MPLMQGLVLPPSTTSYGAATPVTFLAGKQSEGVTTQLHGKYYTQAINGNVYVGSTAAAGVIVPISSGVTPTFTVWNPAGSGVNASLICAYFSWSATTSATGALAYAWTANAGSGISATAPFVAFGTGTPQPALIGGSSASKCRLAVAGTTTLIAAATFLRTAGVSLLTTPAATAGSWWTARDDIDGSIVLGPSSAIHVCGTTAVLATVAITLIWEECPV